MAVRWLLPLGLWGWLWGNAVTSISVMLWTAMCMRVTGRIFSALHPAATPKLDFATVRKSVIGF